MVLDTNIYCDYAEGLPEVVDAIATHGQYLFIPSIVIGELHYGFMKGSRHRFNETKLRQMISRLKIEIINVDTEVARKYALIYLFLQKRGLRYLRLFRDFARKRWPLRGSLKIILINFPLCKRGIEGDLNRSQIPPRPPLLKGGNPVGNVSTIFCRYQFPKRLSMTSGLLHPVWKLEGHC